MTDKLYTPSKPIVFTEGENNVNVQGSDTDQVNLQSSEVSANADASTNKPTKSVVPAAAKQKNKPIKSVKPSFNPTNQPETTSEVQRILYGTTDPGAIAQYQRRKNKKRRIIIDNIDAVAPVGDLAESIKGWHLAEVWHDGGDKTNSSWDLSTIVNDAAHTANEINSINWANEGAALLTANPNQDSIYGFTCSTPYDVSTAVWDGTRVSTATTVLLQSADWSHDGNYYMTNNVWSKRLDMHAAAAPYVVDSTDVRSSTCTNAELGFDDTVTGNACMSPDGTAIYALGEMQTNIISLLKRTLETPYDLSDRGTLVTQEVESQGITTLAASTGHLMIDASETYMWLVYGGTLARGYMSTPGDITTITWVYDVAERFHPYMDGGSMTGACFDHTGTKLYCVNSGATAADSEMRVFTRSGANRNATGTITGTTLNGMSKVQTLTDGGVGVLDLNPLVSALTTKIVESMQWGVDGKYLITLDGTNQTAQMFECSTPYDISTATAQGTPDTFLGAGSSCVGMDYFGEYAYHVKGSTDTLNVMILGTTHALRYTTAPGNSIFASMIDTELGHTQASDGQITFSEDGYSVYGLIEKADGVYFAKGAINTEKQRYDVDEITEVTDINIDSDFSSLPGWSGGDMRVVGNGKYVLYLVNEILYLGTMSTANDVSTLTWDKTNTLDVSGDGNMVGFAYNQALTKFWFLSNTSGTPVITVYE